jgi:hypothetical protein
MNARQSVLWKAGAGLLVFAFLAGCGGGGGGGGGGGATETCTVSAGLNHQTEDGPFSVVTTFPPNGATGVDPNSVIVLFFDDNLNSSTINSTNITVQGSAGAVAGTFAFDCSTAANAMVTFIPSSPFAVKDTVKVTMGTGLQDDDNGGFLGPVSFSFMTGTGAGGSATAPISIEDTAPPGVACVGDCGFLPTFGSAPPILGSYSMYFSSGDPTVTTTSPAMANTSSFVAVSSVPTGGAANLTFQYNFISEEFDEFVGTIFDDVFLVAVAGPGGVVFDVVTSVNIVGAAASTPGTYPTIGADSLFDAHQTGNLTHTLNVASLGSPLNIVFIVSDVGDTILPSVVVLDNIAFQ